METLEGLKRTDYCGTLTAKDVGRTVTLCGWVQRQRDLGSLIFIDLRDRTGIVQLAFDENTDKAVFDKPFREKRVCSRSRRQGKRAFRKKHRDCHRRNRG